MNTVRSQAGWCLVFISVLACSDHAAAQAGTSICDAILSHGIYDKDRVLDARSSFELAQEALCDSSTHSVRNDGSVIFNGGYGTDTFNEDNARQFCRSSYTEARHSSVLWTVSEHVNATIVNAWSQCMAQSHGVSHFLHPFQDHLGFEYEIFYRNDGAPYTVTLDSVTITPSNVSCSPKPSHGMIINSGGKTFQCSRVSLNDDVKITLNIVNGIGTANLRGIELPAFHTDDPLGPMERESDIKALHDGKICHVHLSGPYQQHDAIFGGSDYSMAIEPVPPNKVGPPFRWLSAGPVANTDHPYWTFDLSRAVGKERGDPADGVIWVVSRPFTLANDGLIKSTSTDGTELTGHLLCDR